jgi:hypothetical protein
MSPKEKAEDLVDKMLFYTAKECALIAVNEIIRLDIFNCNCEWSDEDGDTREYWQEVKQEIEKL